MTRKPCIIMANLWFGGAGAPPPVQEDEANYELWDSQRVGEYLAQCGILRDQLPEFSDVFFKNYVFTLSKVGIGFL